MFDLKSLLFGLGCGALSFAIIMLSNKKKRQAKSLDGARKAAERREKVMLSTYKVFDKIPVLSYVLRNTRLSYLKLNTLSEADLLQEVCKSVTMQLGIVSGVAIIGFLIIDNFICNIGFILIGITLAKLYASRRRSKIEVSLLDGLVNGIALIRENYLVTNRVQDALELSQFDKSVTPIMDDIIDVLAASDKQKALDVFIEKNECIYANQLAMICVNIDEMGDANDEKAGQELSTFTECTKFLMEDVYTEMDRIKNTRSKFKNKWVAPLIFPIFVGIIPNLLTGEIAGLNRVYNSLVGTILQLAVLVSCAVAEYMVAKKSETVPFEKDDGSAFVRKFINTKFGSAVSWYITPHDTEAGPSGLKTKLNADLIRARSNQTLREYCTARLAYALIGIVLGAALLVSALQMQKNYALYTTDNLALIASDDLDAYTDEVILESDAEALNYIYNIAVEQQLLDADAEQLCTTQDMIDNVLTHHYAAMSQLQLEDQASRVFTKYNLWKNARTKWWYVLVVFALGYFTSCWPKLKLKTRRQALLGQRQEEFLSLQTIACIMAECNRDTIDTLEAMYKTSYIYKNELLDCYINYMMAPEKELERLRVAVSDSPNFARLIDKMKHAVADTTIAEAFADIKIERTHVVDDHKLSVRETIDRNFSEASTFLGIPKYAFLADFIVPIMMVALSGFGNAMDMVNMFQ